MSLLLDQIQRLPPAVTGVLHVAGDLLIIVVLTWLALRVAGRAVAGMVSALLDRETSEGTAQELSAIEIAKRKATLQSLGGTVVRTLIVLIAFVTALGVVDVNIGPAIAGLGIAGLALGLGAQSLVKDYLAGAFILIENQFAKGDVVQIAGVSGTVEDFSLRRTTLRDLDGTVHTVPNGLIAVSSNMTRVWARINIDVRVAYGTDLGRATDVVDSAGREMAEDPIWQRRVLEAPHVDRVSSLNGPGITLKVLGSVRAADRWSAAGELRRRLATAFADQGIDLQA